MKKIAFLFPGQGAQYVGMGKELCENFKIAADTFEEADNTLGFNLKKLCFEGDKETLTQTENAQPAILCASVAAFRVYLSEIGVKPSFLAGHSLGEYSALTCAEVLEFKDALKIVRNRGLFMTEVASNSKGAMAAVSKVNSLMIEKICGDISKPNHQVVISNYNAPDQTVISGDQAAVEEAISKLKERGASAIPLKVSGAFHSPLMQAAADKLEVELKKYNMHHFKWPVLSNVKANPYQKEDNIVEILKMQLTQPVRWVTSMQYLRDNGVQISMEFGPGKVLKNLMNKNQEFIKSYSFDNDKDRSTFKEEIEKEKKFIPNLLGRALAIAVATPNSNWDNDEYEKGVVIPYRNIKKIYLDLEKEDKVPTKEQMDQAIEMLKSVFKTKKTSVEEQQERFNQLFEETENEELYKDFTI